MDSILIKIQKLLSLASSANEYEAQRANEKVQELLLAHNLSIADLPKSQSDVEQTEVLAGTKTVKWKKDLLTAVAVFYDCQTLTTSKHKSVVTSIIGSPANSAVVALMFDYFVKAIDRVVVEEKRLGRLPSGVPTFRHGVALRISAKLCDRKASIARDGFTNESGNVSALVVQSQSAQAREQTEAWFTENCPDATSRRTRIKASGALNSGYRAGDRVGVDTQLNPVTQRQLAGAAK